MFFGIDHNGQQRGNARVAEESADRVVIELTRLQPVGGVTLIGGYQPLHADVELREPVGDRAVIDASAGVARPPLAELGLPRKRRRRRPRKAPVMDPPRVMDTPVPTHRRPGQVWFSATGGDAVYEAMLPAGDPPVDENGEPVVRPAVRRDVLEAIRRDIADTVHASAAGLELAWAGDELVVEGGGDEYTFRPGPDGLYEVGPLARIVGMSQWIEIDPPLPDGPIDTDTAVDLLERLQQRYPTLGLIVRRLELDVLRAARPRVTPVAVQDAVDDEIAERTHGFGARFFGWHLRALERGTDDRGWHAGYLCQGPVTDRDAILGLVPDAGERVLALLRAEDDPEARGWLAATLGPLGHRPAIPDLIALLDDPYRHVRTQAAEALGAVRAGEATSALQRMLTTERGRTDPPPPNDRMPTRRDKEAERDVRAALLAISGRRYEPPVPPAARSR